LKRLVKVELAAELGLGIVASDAMIFDDELADGMEFVRRHAIMRFR